MDDEIEIIKYRTILAESDRAFRFDIEGDLYWFPKSQSKLLSGNRVAVPLWLAREKGLAESVDIPADDIA